MIDCDRTFLWSVYHNSEYTPVTDFYLEDDWIPTGESKKLRIKTLPVGATNIIGDGSYTWSVNSSAFSITQGASSTVAASNIQGTATLTVTYNPTGLTKSFRIYRGAVREGTYMIRNKESGKYMNVINGSFAEWERIAQYSYHTEDYAKWNITMLPEGDYLIQAKHSNKYLRIANHNSIISNIIQYSNYDISTTRWKLVPTSEGAVKIVPRDNDSLALTLPNDGTQYSDGTSVIQNTYIDDSNYIDEWYIDDGYNEHKKIVSGAVYSIINTNSGKHVAINPSNLLDGSDVIQKTEVEAEGSMLWQINHIGNGEYKIMNLAAERLLSIDGSWSTQGADSQIWHDDGTTGQIFKIRENSDNTYSFLTKCSGFTKALTVSGASTAENTILEQTTYTGSASQKFDLESNYVMLYICSSDQLIWESTHGYDMFGHSWIEVTNLTSDPIEVGYYSLNKGDHISVGRVGGGSSGPDFNRHFQGIWYNCESYFHRVDGIFTDYTRKGTLVKLSQLELLTAYTKEVNSGYNLITNNCVMYAVNAWNRAVNTSLKIMAMGDWIDTPNELEALICEMFDDEAVDSPSLDADRYAYYNSKIGEMIYFDIAEEE